MSDLDTLNDAQLSEVFAVEVAGWRAWFEERGGYTHFIWQRAGEREPWMSTQRHEEAKKRYRAATPAELNPMKHVYSYRPTFATSADAVLPILQAQRSFHLSYSLQAGNWTVQVNVRPENQFGFAPTFARAACMALILAKRAENGGAK